LWLPAWLGGRGRFRALMQSWCCEVRESLHPPETIDSLHERTQKNDGLDRYFKVNMLFLLICCLFCRQTGRLLSSFVIIGPHSAHRRHRNESFHVFTGSTTMTGI
jgi:hypothetical protein